MALSVTVLKRSDFRRLLFTRSWGITALQAQAVIVGWQIYSLTGDVRMLGLAGLVEAVPAIICSLFSGHLVDISRPHRVYVTCIGVLTANMAMLFLLGGGLLHAGDVSVLPFLFVGIFISGVARSFIMPASFSLLPQIVPRDEIPSAAAWLSSGFQTGAIAGPALAGILYGGYGVTIAWLMPMVLMSSAFIALFGMGQGTRQFRRAGPYEKAAKSIRDGWRFIFTHPTLLSIMALDMFAVLLGGAIAILPAYADQVLHVGAEELGLLRASPALGAIGAALFLALRPMRQMQGTHLLMSVTGFGLCMIGFGLTNNLWVALLMLGFSGAFDSVSMVMRSSMMQLLIPEHMRGRVSSVNSMFIISSNEIGAARAGYSAAWLGLVPSILVGGISTLLVVTLTALLSPRLRQLIVDPKKQE